MVDPKTSTISSKNRRSSSKVASQLSRATPNSIRGGDIKIDLVGILNKRNTNQTILNDVTSESTVRRSGHGTTDSPTTYDHEVEHTIGVQCNKKRAVISPSMNDVSTLENEDIDGVLATGLGGNSHKKHRGACNFSKISQMTRVTNKLIEIRLDPDHGRPTGDEVVSSLLSHTIGGLVRNCIPMHDGYWGKVDAIKKDEAIRSLLSYFDFETDKEGKIEPETSHYLKQQFAKSFREFKNELHTYFKTFSPEDAKCRPPPQWGNRGKANWITMCNHFLSEKFQNQSKENKENRGKKQYEHHGGSKPISLRYENHVKKKSQFPDIDAFKETYTKSGEWTNDVVKKKYEEMVSQSKILLQELAAGYPEGTEVEKIIVPPDAGRNILMKTLGIKPGREIRGLGFGRYRDLGSSKTTQGIASSSRLNMLEQQVVDERTARLHAEERLHVTEERLHASDAKMNALARALYNQGFSLPEGFDECAQDDEDTTPP